MSENDIEFERWLTIAELAREAEIAESTTRRYLAKFEEFFKFEERSRGRRFHPSSIEILKLIQTLYVHDRLETDEIKEILSKQFAITVNLSEEAETNSQAHLPAIATKGDIEELLRAFTAVKNESLELSRQQEQKLTEMQQAILSIQEENKLLHRQLSDKLEERDRVVTETLRAIQNAKQNHNDDVAKPWWKRIIAKS